MNRNIIKSIKRVVEKIKAVINTEENYSIYGDDTSEDWLTHLKIDNKIRLFPDFYSAWLTYEKSHYLVLVNRGFSSQFPSFLQEETLNSGAWVVIIDELDLFIKKDADRSILEEILDNEWKTEKTKNGEEFKSVKIDEEINGYTLKDFFPNIYLYKIIDRFTQKEELNQITGIALTESNSYCFLPYSAEVLQEFKNTFENGNKYIPFENILASYVASDFKFAYLDLYRCIEGLLSTRTIRHIVARAGKLAGLMNDLIVHLTWLETLGEIAPYLQGLTRAKIKHFTSEAKAITASEMKDITLNKQLTLLLCLIYSAQVQTRDYLVEMFLKQMKKIHNLAIEELDSIRKRQQITTEKLVSVLTDVLVVCNVDTTDSNSNPQNSNPLEQLQAIFKQTGGVEQLLTECEEINAYQGNNYFPLLWRFYKSHRSAFFRVFKFLKIESTSSDDKLVKAVEILLSNSHRRGEWIATELDLSFISQQWQKLVIIQSKDATKVMRRHFEICIFSYLAAELKSGDICVFNSEAYADYREQLLSWQDCQPLVETYCQQLGFSTQAEDFVENLKNLLIQTAVEVDLGYPNNTSVVISEEGEPVLKRPAANVETASLKNLAALISERMPERNLIDILRNVDYWTNFTRHFGPLSGSDPKLERATERYLLTTFTYGCNLGAAQAARDMRGVVTSRMLTFVNQRHINLKGLNAALVDIINRYNVMPLTKFWGDGTTAAADGTKYDLYEQNLLSEYHIRYGGYGGIAYHHVADSYIAGV
jgi:hypothetical protein